MVLALWCVLFFVVLAVASVSGLVLRDLVFPGKDYSRYPYKRRKREPQKILRWSVLFILFVILLVLNFYKIVSVDKQGEQRWDSSCVSQGGRVVSLHHHNMKICIVGKLLDERE